MALTLTLPAAVPGVPYGFTRTLKGSGVKLKKIVGPDWLKVDLLGQTLLGNGTPPAAGRYSLVVQVEDTCGDCVEIVATIGSDDAAAECEPPYLVDSCDKEVECPCEACLLPDGKVGSPYNGTLLFAGNGLTIKPVMVSIPGLTVVSDSSNGVLLLTGTPTVAGSYPVLVYGRNSSGEAVFNCAVTISSAGPGTGQVDPPLPTPCAVSAGGSNPNGVTRTVRCPNCEGTGELYITARQDGDRYVVVTDDASAGTTKSEHFTDCTAAMAYYNDTTGLCNAAYPTC